jgi:release factor glutamine methyltransferase
MISESANVPFIGKLLADAESALVQSGVDSARLDAELLMAATCAVERATLLAGTVRLTQAQSESFAAMLARRAAREPLAYIVRRREFFSLEFEVTRAVMIPRPETETLVETALEFLGQRAEAHVLDIGTGSGAVAVAIAVNAPQVAVTATDISAQALEVARRNAARHGLKRRIALLEADLLPQGAQAVFDLIVSNPPYVESQAIESLAPEVRLYEPRIALEGGSDGLKSSRAIARVARSHLAPGGAVMVEVGAGQARRVRELFLSAGFANVTSVRDLGGTERVVCARRAA